MRRGNWSVQELERLRQLLPARGVLTTAQLLRRSAVCVERKAAELLRVPPRRGDWTDSDDQVLQDAWGAVDARLLAMMLGRMPHDVRKRATDLRERPLAGPWKQPERQRLKRLYGTRADADLEVCLRRPAGEVRAMAQALCLAKDKRFAAAVAGAGGVASAVRAFAGRPTHMPRWTAGEVERLRAIYPDRDNLAVAQTLGRTVTSVANKANQLGLHKSPVLLADIGRANVSLRYRPADPTTAVTVATPGRVAPIEAAAQAP
ncbi:MAG: hypothetical protein FJ301_04235 [Planctomycetes bacterium]|nr:hypothetical protein [Planctomycetota bacterium]